MFCLKYSQFYSNTDFKFTIFNNFSNSNIEYIYNQFIKQIKISCLCSKPIIKICFLISQIMLI